MFAAVKPYIAGAQPFDYPYIGLPITCQQSSSAVLDGSLALRAPCEYHLAALFLGLGSLVR